MKFMTLYFIYSSVEDLIAGFPASGKIMETLKMKKTFSGPGKIMEFEKSPKNLEKSWNFEKSTWKNHGICSDLRLYACNFSCATRTFQISIIHAYITRIINPRPWS